MSVDSPAAQPATPDRLIEQCLSGDQAAWETIVRQNWRKVFNVAYKFVGRHDEAEDLTQDIFLKIFKALGTFDPGDLQPASSDRTPYAAAEHQDLRAMLRDALQTLPPTLRTAVVLRDLQELSYQEIAAKLQLPEGTVKSRINRGRLELARQLKRLQDKQSAARGRGAPSRPRARRSGVQE